MDKVGVFICNYNKAEFVVRCVKSIREQTYRELDIWVVDNASTDDSVEKLRESFGKEINLIENEENIGGSGGFGRGIRMALESGYKYFMLVDNDAFLDQYAVEHLYNYMEEHEDTGICGAEILCMQHPDKIQDLGGRLDLENYFMGGIIAGVTELSGNAVLECDYVASCTVMARTEAVRKFGGFPEENFIYWDDVEWCTKCWKAGYKVIVNGFAKAYHDFSDRDIRNMFFRYYVNRNRYKFYTKYLPEEKLEDFYQTITREFFSQNYAAMNKGKYGTVLTAWNALDDFMHGITGKAKEGKIVPYAEGLDRLAGRVAKAKSVIIYMARHTGEDYSGLNNIFRYLMKHNKDIEIMVTFQLEEYNLSEYDLVLELCTHVTRIKENILPRIYIDPWRNYVLDEDDYQYFCNYEQSLTKFQEMYRPLFARQVKELRKE